MVLKLQFFSDHPFSAVHPSMAFVSKFWLMRVLADLSVENAAFSGSSMTYCAVTVGLTVL